MPTGAHGRVGGHRWRKLVAYVLERDASICWLCGHPGADSGDHVVPLKHGGAELDPENVRAVHHRRCPTCNRACNQSRNARPVTPAAVTLNTSRRWF